LLIWSAVAKKTKIAAKLCTYLVASFTPVNRIFNPLNNFEGFDDALFGFDVIDVEEEDEICGIGDFRRGIHKDLEGNT
jgi:hypothetical protein